MNTLNQPDTMEIDFEQLRDWKPLLVGLWLGLTFGMLVATSYVIVAVEPATTEGIKELRWFAAFNAAAMLLLLWNLLMRILAEMRFTRQMRKFDY